MTCFFAVTVKLESGLLVNSHCINILCMLSGSDPKSFHIIYKQSITNITYCICNFTTVSWLPIHEIICLFKSYTIWLKHRERVQALLIIIYKILHSTFCFRNLSGSSEFVGTLHTFINLKALISLAGLIITRTKSKICSNPWKQSLNTWSVF